MPERPWRACCWVDPATGTPDYHEGATGGVLWRVGHRRRALRVGSDPSRAVSRAIPQPRVRTGGVAEVVVAPDRPPRSPRAASQGGTGASRRSPS